MHITSLLPSDSSALPPSACLFVSALAIKPGHTKLTLLYLHEDLHLEASVVIAAYPPLTPLQPQNIALLTLGSSYDFIFEGGPAPWLLDKSKYFQNFSAEVPEQLSVYGRMDESVRVGQLVWRVVCRALNEQSLRLEVGNRPTLKNAYPASEIAVTRVACVLPVSMAITPVVALLEVCPLLQSSNQNTRIPVMAGHRLDLEVNVFDAENRKFDNFSSLHWVWGSSNHVLLRPPAQGDLVHRREGGAFLMVELSELSGSVVMTASVNSYQPHFLAAENIESEVT